MSSDTIITVENLSKRYRLGVIGATSLRESVERAWHRLRGRDWREAMGKVGVASRQVASGKGKGESGRGTESGGNVSHTLATEETLLPLTPSPLPPEPSRSDELWALKDVSFEVKRGEVLGVIGRNGAGKSTLLKILTRITEPTSGRAIMRGRVASLLEVGTGFHPELTGRENIYLNGAILGMKRVEITRKFDEIVAFAETEKFIDTPVKRYSSGMYVRLAFAVAAHLDPEILLVDEVLAVGDAAFQKKCLGKMRDVAIHGRTVLFVSHNMPAISALCGRVMIISNGTVTGIELPDVAISRYFVETGDVMQTIPLFARSDRKGNQSVTIQNVTFHTLDNCQIDHIMSGQSVSIRFHYSARHTFQNSRVLIAFNVRNEYGQIIANFNSEDTGDGMMPIFANGIFECRWPKVNLRAGVYHCTVFCRINAEIADWVPDAFVLPVEDGDFYGSGRLIDKSQGYVLIDHSWRQIGDS